jgi:uncharacterized protein
MPLRDRMTAARQPLRPYAHRKPSGARLLRLTWSNLLFLHWPVDARVLRPLVPAELEIDLFDGQAWIGVVPFSMEGVRPVLAPAVPGLSSLLEVNVRTYVRFGSEAGVFFFSLDASSAPAVWLARAIFHLPYFRARLEMGRRGDTVRFASRRTHQGAAPCEFECAWAAKAPLARTKPGELGHFLTERYQFFTRHRRCILSGRIWHEPWPLRDAKIGTLRSSMIEAAGLPAPEGAPLAYHCDALAVSMWPLSEAAAQEVGGALLGPALSPPAATLTR